MGYPVEQHFILFGYGHGRPRRFRGEVYEADQIRRHLWVHVSGVGDGVDDSIQDEYEFEGRVGCRPGGSASGYEVGPGDQRADDGMAMGLPFQIVRGFGVGCISFPIQAALQSASKHERELSWRWRRSALAKPLLPTL
jgi:hypothetical protein